MLVSFWRHDFCFDIPWLQRYVLKQQKSNNAKPFCFPSLKQCYSWKLLVWIFPSFFANMLYVIRILNLLWWECHSIRSDEGILLGKNLSPGGGTDVTKLLYQQLALALLFLFLVKIPLFQLCFMPLCQRISCPVCDFYLLLPLKKLRLCNL